MSIWFWLFGFDHTVVFPRNVTDFLDLESAGDLSEFYFFVVDWNSWKRDELRLFSALPYVVSLAFFHIPLLFLCKLLAFGD